MVYIGALGNGSMELNSVLHHLIYDFFHVLNSLIELVLSSTGFTKAKIYSARRVEHLNNFQMVFWSRHNERRGDWSRVADTIISMLWH
jgi:hypothetical protein